MKFLLCFFVFVVGVIGSVQNGIKNESDLIHIISSEMDGVLKLDFELSDPRNHFHVDKVWACSSIDIEIEPYSDDRKNETGCNTNGFISEQIYGAGTEERVDSSFRTELRYKTMFLHEGILDERTPVVYIQIKVRITDELGDPIEGGNMVEIIGRYTNLHPEEGQDKSFGEFFRKDEPISIIALQSSLMTESEEDLLNSMHWYYLTFGGLGVCVVFVILGLAIIKIKDRLSNKRDTSAYVGLDMETGVAYGVGVEEISEKRSDWKSFALRKGIWRRRNK